MKNKMRNDFRKSAPCGIVRLVRPSKRQRADNLLKAIEKIKAERNA